MYEKRSEDRVSTPSGSKWKPPKNVGNKEANPFYDVSLEDASHAPARRTGPLF